MDFQDFCDLERIGDKAIRAAKTFAEGEDKKYLLKLSMVLAELRHAADTLCDPYQTVDQKREASARLRELFTDNLTKGERE